MGYREVWGYKRTIRQIKRVTFLGLAFDALCFAPMDNVLGLLDVLNFSVTSYDVANDGEAIAVFADGDETYIKGNSILGLVHRKLVGLNLDPIYRSSVVASEEDEFERKAYLADIGGLGNHVREEFRSNKIVIPGTVYPFQIGPLSLNK